MKLLSLLLVATAAAKLLRRTRWRRHFHAWQQANGFGTNPPLFSKVDWHTLYAIIVRRPVPLMVENDAAVERFISSQWETIKEVIYYNPYDS